MLSVQDTIVLIVDVQGRLAELMADKEEIFANLERLIRGADVLGLPILWLEQYPEGLGPTIESLAALLAPARQPMPKVSFSCWGCPAFVEALKGAGRRQVLLAGIETHVCIYQTTVDLLAEGYEVQVVGDAVSSRTASNRALGLQRVRDLGAAVTSVEMALFELQRVAQGEQFRALSRIVR